MRDKGGEGGGHACKAPCMQEGNEGDDIHVEWWLNVLGKLGE